MTFAEALAALYPRPMAVSLAGRVRAAVGAGIGIGVTAWASLMIAQALHLSPWLVAPLGASAVLVFAVPASPLAQPWPVIGGNTLSAAIGILVCNLIPDPVIAASLAVGLAIAAMFALRCLHPPGGAMALLVVLTHVHSPAYILFPALGNSLLLVLAGLVWNNLTHHSYPHVVPAAPPGPPRITEADLAAALREQDEVFDIADADLARLLERIEQLALQRHTGAVSSALARPPA